MKLLVDVMGGDSKFSDLITGIRNFQKQHNDVNIVLCGDKSIIDKCIDKTDKFEIIHASDVVHTEDSPLKILRSSTSSMYVGLKEVSEGRADGMLTAGSTPAYVLLSFHIIKPINGVNKPAFMSYVPTVDGRGFMFLDVGANLHCSKDDLVQFAKMGNIYCREIRKYTNPRISILNIGTETNKGFEFQQEAHQILKNDKTLNYLGFIESRDLLTGETDIVVADGYSGNMTLKALEGSLMTVNSILKTEFKKPKNLLGAIFSLGVIKKIKKSFDYKRYAGAFVIGLQKNICKTHGNAKSEEILSALNMLYDSVNLNLVDKIEKNINE
jgi:glycerol-3-phosphate acyltransferase PlsX